MYDASCRAAEIIGTLLEVTPSGQQFPSARDTRAPLAGGRHARAARNQGQGTAVNLRLATVLGLSIFVASIIDSSYGTSWHALGVTAPGLAAGMSPWLGRRTAAAGLAASLLTVPAGSVRQAADFALDGRLLLLLITVWWLVVDARPAFGLGIAQLAALLPVLPVTAEQYLGSGYEVIIGERLAIELAVTGSVMLPAP